MTVEPHDATLRKPSNFLFDDRLAPITSTIGFVEVECERAAEAFIAWRGRINERVKRRDVAGELEEVLLELLPLTDNDRRRFLFVPTRSPWTAYFDNGVRGAEPQAHMSYLAAEIGCRGVRAVAVPNTERRRGGGRCGAVILEVYGPEDTEFLNVVRTVAAANDAGRWRFTESGDPFPFERTDRYREPSVPDRFTVEMLREYLEELGIRAFDEEFYRPDDGAILVEKKGWKRLDVREYTLEDARADF